MESFRKLNKRKVSESSYCNIFQSVLEIVLNDTDIDVDDGENVSNSTRRMAILNQYDEKGFGRRIDLITHEYHSSHDIEYCGIEFKKESVNTSLLQHQQSKNIRINGTILNDSILLTKDLSQGCIFMDWFGPTGYMVELFKYKNCHVAYHISSLHLPTTLLELDDFRETVKHLYKWKTKLVEVSRGMKLALLKDKRKYETITISTSTTPTTSPNRSPPLLPIDIFFTPSKNKKVKKAID